MACASSSPSFSPFLRSPFVVHVRSLSMRVSATCTSAEPAATNSLYQVLGVPRGATCHEIKAAYRRLVRIWHPDMVASDQRDTSADKFMKLHELTRLFLTRSSSLQLGSTNSEIELLPRSFPAEGGPHRTEEDLILTATDVN